MIPFAYLNDAGGVGRFYTIELTSPTRTLWSSADGITWTPQVMPVAGQNLINALYAKDNFLYFIGAASGTFGIYRTIDGTAVTQVRPIGSSTFTSFQQWDGRLIGVYTGNNITSSFDGINWANTTYAAGSVSTTGMGGKQPGGPMYIASDTAGSQYRYSTDLTNWPVTVLPYAGGRNFQRRPVYAFGAFWCPDGATIGGNLRVNRTVTGTGSDWITVNIPTTAAASNIYLLNDQLVITTGNNLIFKSYDGFTWTSQVPVAGPTNYLHAFYANGTYIITANAGVFYSKDGMATWQASNLGTGNWYGLAFKL